MKETILIIDDENDLRSLLVKLIKLENYTTLDADTGEAGLSLLRKEDVAVVITDVKLPDINGIDMIKKIKSINQLCEVIVLTAYGTIEDGVKAIKEGAFDYITKGDEDNKIIPLLDRAIEKGRLKKRIESLEKSVKEKFSFNSIGGDSEAINNAKDIASKVAQTDTPVLILGETGTGKELFAQAIHYSSIRNKHPFVAVNCSAISKELLESEMFGYKAGAFTGANKNKKGLFEEAHLGTLFLDEIGEMPLGTQARLLRVLETGEFIRVGSSKVQKTDVRVIAATNRELLEFTQKGRFREDLYYRLSTVPIRVPSLRDRKEDVLLLFRKFVVDFAERYKTTPVQLEDDAKSLLINHPWQGNVRELKNIAEQISVLSPTNQISATTLSQFLPDQSKYSRMPVLAAHTANGSGEFANEREILYKLFFDMKKDVTELKKMFLEILQNPSLAGSAANFTRDSLLQDFQGNGDLQTVVSTQVSSAHQIMPANGQPVLLHEDDIHHHEEVEESLNIMDKEKELILKALKKHKGKRRDASLDLGISERTLYRKLKEYDIEE